MPQLRPYRGLAERERIQTNAEVKSFLALLARPDNAQAVAALQLEADIEALCQALDEIYQVFDSLGAEYAEMLTLRDIQTPKVVHDINAHYTAMVRVVNAWAVAMPSPQLAQFFGV